MTDCFNGKRVVIEWGVRFSNGEVFTTGSEEAALALGDEDAEPVSRRVVHYGSTYGTWEHL